MSLESAFTVRRTSHPFYLRPLLGTFLAPSSWGEYASQQNLRRCVTSVISLACALARIRTKDKLVSQSVLESGWRFDSNWTESPCQRPPGSAVKHVIIQRKRRTRWRKNHSALPQHSHQMTPLPGSWMCASCGMARRPDHLSEGRRLFLPPMKSGRSRCWPSGSLTLYSVLLRVYAGLVCGGTP